MKTTWQAKMKRLKLEYLQATSPDFFQASGGFTMLVAPYADTTNNKLTKSIIDFLTFKGHKATRVNSQGQMRVHKVPRHDIFSGKDYSIKKIQWSGIPGAAGTPGISVVINDRPVLIGVKTGRNTESQEKGRGQYDPQASGELYFIAGDMPGFIEWYEALLLNTAKEGRMGTKFGNINTAI